MVWTFSGLTSGAWLRSAAKGQVLPTTARLSTANIVHTFAVRRTQLTEDIERKDEIHMLNRMSYVGVISL